MCTHVSNIVTKANQSDAVSVAVSLSRSSFEKEEILTGWFSFILDDLSQKNEYIYQKTKCFGKLGIYQRVDLAKERIKKCYIAHRTVYCVYELLK